MTFSAIALTAVAQLAIAQAAPELVVLPLATEGAKASDGLAAWKVVTAAVERSKKKLDVSTSLQKKQHDFLVGPAREQARDCGFEAPCLAEVGSTLGADVLVAGRIEKDGVVLTAIDVNSGVRVADGRSLRKLRRRTLTVRSRDASQRLIRTLTKHMKKAKAVAAAAPKKKPAPEVEPPKADPITDPITEPLDDGAAPVAAATGSLLIPASELRGVSRVAVDGDPVSFSGDGSITWTGAPGTHRLVATRADGQSIARDVRIDPNDTAQISLEFPAITAPPPPTVAATVVEEPSPTSKWWFWTAIGAAVVAGGSTAALLALGDKGGPSLPSSSGTIRGTY